MGFYRVIIILTALVLAVDLLYALLQTGKRAAISTLLLLNAAVFTFFSNASLWYSGVYVDEHNLSGEPLLFLLNVVNILLFIGILLVYLHQFRRPPEIRPGEEEEAEKGV